MTAYDRRTGWIDPAVMDQDSEHEPTTPVGDVPDGLHANVMTSEILLSDVDRTWVGDGPWHAPVIDLDLPCELIESSTPGHYHLYVDAMVDHEAYMNLLDALHACGLIGDGYWHHSKERGYTVVRMPHSRKGQPDQVPEPAHQPRHLRVVQDGERAWPPIDVPQEPDTDLPYF